MRGAKETLRKYAQDDEHYSRIATDGLRFADEFSRIENDVLKHYLHSVRQVKEFDYRRTPDYDCRVVDETRIEEDYVRADIINATSIKADVVEGRLINATSIEADEIRCTVLDATSVEVDSLEADVKSCTSIKRK